MKYIHTLITLEFIYSIPSCTDTDREYEDKGFQVGSYSDDSDDSENELVAGINKDSLIFDTKPSNVLLTGHSEIRLTTIYKVNYNKKKKTTFIGSNNFHYRYESEEYDIENNWNNNIMPGIEAAYGYNMVNVSHYNLEENKQKSFFKKPVLIKTLYYPTFSKDTLNNIPINRDYFIVSVYDEDTNKDGFINLKDLRRLYLFDINGENKKALISKNYSVFKSEYGLENDLMLVFGQLDKNTNGIRDEGEPIHIFWIDLKDPNTTGQLY